MKYLILFLLVILLNACELHKWDLDRDDFKTTEEIILNNKYNIISQLDLKAVDNSGNYHFVLDSSNMVFKCELDVESFLIKKQSLVSPQNVRAYWRDNAQEILLYESNDNSPNLPVFTKKDDNQIYSISYSDIKYLFNTYPNPGSVQEIQLFDFAVAKNDDIFACGFSKQLNQKPRAFVLKMNKYLKIDWMRPLWPNTRASHIFIDPLDDYLILDGQEVDGGYTFVNKIQPIKLGKITNKQHSALGGNRGHHTIQHQGNIYHIGIYKYPPYNPAIVHYDTNLNNLGYYALSTKNCNNPAIIVNRKNAVVAAYSENENYTHLTEINPDIKANSKIWCNRFNGNENYRLLDLVQTKDFGFLLLMQHKNTGEIKIIKTDEEGATRAHPYVQNNPNCY